MLFGEGVKIKIKKLFIEECNLYIIVCLLNGVFNFYISIKINLLFFIKGQLIKEIWFYEYLYLVGVKNYSKIKLMKFEEFQVEIDWWGNEVDGFVSCVENEQVWKVSIDDVIVCNFNLDIKNLYQVEIVSYDLDELLVQYVKQQVEIQMLCN